MNEDKYTDRRRTRVVFPSSQESLVWSTVVTLLVAWVTWISSTLIDVKTEAKQPMRCFPTKAGE